jgi:hypothetical protein
MSTSFEAATMREECKPHSLAKLLKANEKCFHNAPRCAWNARQLLPCADGQATAALLLFVFVFFLQHGGGGDGIVIIKPQ